MLLTVSLVKIIMFIYAPAWFIIEQHNLKDGVHNFYEIIKLSKQLRVDKPSVVNHALEIHFFSAHPKSLILAMVSDGNIEAQKSFEKNFMEKNFFKLPTHVFSVAS